MKTINYIQMWRNIMDDYRLYCLNDLFEIKWIFYGLSRMLQFSQFVWTLSYSDEMSLTIFSLKTNR